jgi:hypothetical protein
MIEIVLSILTAVVTIGLAYLIGLCIASHFDILNQDEWQ